MTNAPQPTETVDTQNDATLLATELLPLLVDYISLSKEVKALELKWSQGYGKNHTQLKELWKQQVDLEEMVLDKIQKSVK